MAASKTADAPFVPGGPRDALGPDYDPAIDYVPDLDAKGYHVGLVRQPVRALVDPSTGNIVGFESLAPGAEDEAARPFGPTLKDLKAAHNVEEKGWKAGKEFRQHVGLAPTTVASETGHESAATKARIAELEAQIEELKGPAAEALSYRELQAKAKDLGIPATGNAEELAAAIAEAEGQK